MKKYLSYGMAGAGLNSFIGAVHRVGAGFDGTAFLKAGCFCRKKQGVRGVLSAGRKPRICIV